MTYPTAGENVKMANRPKERARKVSCSPQHCFAYLIQEKKTFDLCLVGSRDHLLVHIIVMK